MRKLSVMQKAVFYGLLFLGLLYVGFWRFPTVWFMPIIVVFGIIFFYYGIKRGFRFWRKGVSFEKENIKVMTPEEANRIIKRFCFNEGIIESEKTPPWFKNFRKITTIEKKNPFFIKKTRIQWGEHLMPILISVDGLTGQCTCWPISKERELSNILEQWSGPTRYIREEIRPGNIRTITTRPMKEGERDEQPKQ